MTHLWNPRFTEEVLINHFFAIGHGETVEPPPVPLTPQNAFDSLLLLGVCLLRLADGYRRHAINASGS